MRSAEELRTAVEKHYAESATKGASCCNDQTSFDIGYRKEDLDAVPDESVLGLGCGNPVSFAGLRDGEVVVDLGSGAGIDVFLAARQVGSSGQVIGVDMTAEMLARARANAQRLGLGNIEFREGLIESLPVADSWVDVILSNCVINLAPDKAPVFRDAFRVLKPGGRLVVSDMVRDVDLPPEIEGKPELWASCMAGALPREEYLGIVRKAGFSDVEVLTEKSGDWGPVYSVTVRAWKPDQAG